MDLSLATVVERLSKRPGVVSVTFCTIRGLVIQTSHPNAEEANKQALAFAAVVKAALEAHATLGIKEQPEVLTVRSAKLEWIATLADAQGGAIGGASPSDFFFLVAREVDNK
jgi:predicted regulator of Ras-like GTPase activity (Roadblock/LC7/MglB family)